MEADKNTYDSDESSSTSLVSDYGDSEGLEATMTHVNPPPSRFSEVMTNDRAEVEEADHLVTKRHRVIVQQSVDDFKEKRMTDTKNHVLKFADGNVNADAERTQLKEERDGLGNSFQISSLPTSCPSKWRSDTSHYESGSEMLSDLEEPEVDDSRCNDLKSNTSCEKPPANFSINTNKKSIGEGPSDMCSASPVNAITPNTDSQHLSSQRLNETRSRSSERVNIIPGSPSTSLEANKKGPPINPKELGNYLQVLLDLLRTNGVDEVLASARNDLWGENSDGRVLNLCEMVHQLDGNYPNRPGASMKNAFKTKLCVLSLGELEEKFPNIIDRYDLETRDKLAELIQRYKSEKKRITPKKTIFTPDKSPLVARSSPCFSDAKIRSRVATPRKKLKFESPLKEQTMENATNLLEEEKLLASEYSIEEYSKVAKLILSLLTCKYSVIAIWERIKNETQQDGTQRKLGYDKRQDTKHCTESLALKYQAAPNKLNFVESNCSVTTDAAKQISEVLKLCLQELSISGPNLNV